MKRLSFNYLIARSSLFVLGVIWYLQTFFKIINWYHIQLDWPCLREGNGFICHCKRRNKLALWNLEPMCVLITQSLNIPEPTRFSLIKSRLYMFCFNIRQNLHVKRSRHISEFHLFSQKPTVSFNGHIVRRYLTAVTLRSCFVCTGTFSFIVCKRFEMMP